MVLQQPKSTKGSCTNTYAAITPGASGVTKFNNAPVLCGTLTGQHCKKPSLHFRVQDIWV